MGRSRDLADGSYIADGAVTPTDLSTGHPSWDSSGNFQINSGYGSVATAYACRAWVNFNGTGTVAIRASGNVSSITDNGTGNYTVNLTTAMPDTNYCAQFNHSYAQYGMNYSSSQVTDSPSVTTSSFRITTSRYGGGSVDPIYVMASVFR